MPSVREWWLVETESGVWKAHDIEPKWIPKYLQIHVREVPPAESDEKLRALQIALGHSNCYCEKCGELSRKYWVPSKSDLSARANPDPRAAELVEALKKALNAPDAGSPNWLYYMRNDFLKFEGGK